MIKLFFLPEKREEFLTSRGDWWGATRSDHPCSEVASPSLSFPNLFYYRPHLLPCSGHRGSPSAHQTQALFLLNWELTQRHQADVILE